MAYEHKENSGSLFKVAAEDRKSETWPEYEGEFHVACPHCEKSTRGWVKAWVKSAKTGSKFFSLAFKHKRVDGGQ